MKIICKDNFDRDSISDRLVCSEIKSHVYADFIADALNKRFGGESSPEYFKAVQDDYKLYVYNPL